MIQGARLQLSHVPARARPRHYHLHVVPSCSNELGSACLAIAVSTQKE